VIGTYHEFGDFISGVATLPRIVTTSDVTIEPVKKGDGLLAMNLTAKTYRYMEQAERAGKSTPNQAKKGRKK
jgi:type IV pilus assembly protein PilO